MPKVKTHKGAAKRIGKTGSGKFVHMKAFKKHKAEAKTAKRRRQLRHGSVVVNADEKRLRIMLPY